MYVCYFMHTCRQLEEKYYTCRRTASRFIGQRNPTAEALLYKKVVCFLTCLVAYGGSQINQCVWGAVVCSGVCSALVLNLYLNVKKICVKTSAQISSCWNQSLTTPTLAFIKSLVIICPLENDSQYKVKCWCNWVNWEPCCYWLTQLLFYDWGCCVFRNSRSGSWREIIYFSTEVHIIKQGFRALIKAALLIDILYINIKSNDYKWCERSHS